MSEVTVGDLNSDAKGTGARKNGGKVMYSLIPMHLLAGVARVLMGGIQKYKSWNWAKGMPWSVCFDCTIRHLNKWWYMREENDEESGQHHIDHAICNLLFIRHYILTYKEGDDRPPSSNEFAKAMDFFNEQFNLDDYLKRNETYKLTQKDIIKIGNWKQEN